VDSGSNRIFLDTTRLKLGLPFFQLWAEHLRSPLCGLRKFSIKKITNVHTQKPLVEEKKNSWQKIMNREFSFLGITKSYLVSKKYYCNIYIIF